MDCVASRCKSSPVDGTISYEQRIEKIEHRTPRRADTKGVVAESYTARRSSHPATRTMETSHAARFLQAIFAQETIAAYSPLNQL